MNQENRYQSKKTVFLGWVICILGAIFYCYEYILRIEPSVMVPELMRQFSLSAEHFGALTALYYFAYTPMQIAVGMLTDIFGPRRMLTFAVLVCALGSVMFGYTQIVFVAAVGRFFFGSPQSPSKCPQALSCRAPKEAGGSRCGGDSPCPSGAAPSAVQFSSFP